MDMEEPPASERDAEVYHFPTPRERAVRRHPASGNETIDETLGRIGVNPTHEDPNAPTGSIYEQMGMTDDDKPDET